RMRSREWQHGRAGDNDGDLHSDERLQHEYLHVHRDDEPGSSLGHHMPGERDYECLWHDPSKWSDRKLPPSDHHWRHASRMRSRKWQSVRARDDDGDLHSDEPLQHEYMHIQRHGGPGSSARDLLPGERGYECLRHHPGKWSDRELPASDDYWGRASRMRSREW